MAFITSQLAKGLFSAGGKIGGFAAGGAGKRAIMGAGIGGLYGGITSDNQNTENFIGDIARAALGGSLIGAGTRLVTPKLTGGYKNPLLTDTVKNIFRPANLKAGALKTSRLGARAAKFVWNHPIATAGIIGTGFALANQTTNPYFSPTIQNLSLNDNVVPQDTSSMNIGSIAPIGGITGGMAMRQQNMMDSTYGLTQALHNQRH